MELRYFFTFEGTRIESQDLSGNPQPALNWKDSEKIIKRSEKYDGITYVFVQKHSFIGNVVAFIDSAKAAGIGSEMIIEIWSLNESTQDWDVEYQGLVDLPNAKKTIKSSGLAVYDITTKPEGFENKFDLNYNTDINLTANTDLDGNTMTVFTRPSDFSTLKPQPIKKEVRVQSEDPNFYDVAGMQVAELKNHYFFLTVFHSLETKQELGDGFQNLPTLRYDDFSYEGPFPTVPMDHESILKNAPHSLTLNDQWMIKADVDGDYTWSWNFAYDITIGTLSPTEKILRWNFWVLAVIIDHTDPINPAYSIEEFDAQGQENWDNTYLILRVTGLYGRTSTLTRGQELYLIPYLTMRTNNTAFGASQVSYNLFDFKVDHSTFTVDAVTKYPETNVAMMLAHEAFSKAVNKITGKFNALRSKFYGRTDSEPRSYTEDGKGSLTAFLSGQHVRGWLIGSGEGKRSFNISLKKLFEAERAKHNIGLGILNNEVIIEERHYFYDKNTILVDLGIITSLEISYDLDRFFNKVKAGYSNSKNSENKEGQGLQVFNAKKFYNTELNVVDKALEIVSDLITAGYMIETTRRENISIDAEKETQNDLKIFAIALLRTGVTIDVATISNPAFINETWDASDPNNPWSNVAGIDFPDQIYNVRWQPSRMVRNWGDELRLSIKQSNDILQLQIVEGNRDFSSQLKTEANPVTEGDDIAGTDLGNDMLFNGELYNFEQPLTNAQIKNVETYPYGYFRFHDSFGKEYRGFLKGEMKISLESKLCTFTLQGFSF